MPQVDSAITFLKVSDIETSAIFYENGLGLNLVLDQGGCLIYQLGKDSYLGICDRTGPVESNVVVTIVSDDVDGWHDRITGAGVGTDGTPRDNPDYRIYHFYVTDPDGHTIEVQRFWDTDWHEPV